MFGAAVRKVSAPIIHTYTQNHKSPRSGRFFVFYFIFIKHTYIIIYYFSQKMKIRSARQHQVRPTDDTVGCLLELLLRYRVKSLITLYIYPVIGIYGYNVIRTEWEIVSVDNTRPPRRESDFPGKFSSAKIKYKTRFA